MSGQLVTRVPGPDAYTNILEQLVDQFGFEAASLQLPETGHFRGLKGHVTVRAEPGALEKNWDPSTGASPERLLLSVGGRSLGLIVLQGSRPPLTPAESRVLRAFCDQFALVLERDRLLVAATDAQVYRQTEELRRSLLAAVSHDLRSPLAAIKASVTDLMDEETSRAPEDAAAALRAIDSEADRMDALIANLLDMSRIEAGMLRAKVQTVDLSEVLAASADRVHAQRPDVRFDLRMPNGASLIRADPVFVDRVVTNLFENAARAASEAARPRIEVVTSRRESVTTVRVIDHGAGFPAAVREQLFYPFYSLQRRDARLGPGLGLAISKGFLSLMHGEIWVEETSGGGSTFAFSLPSSSDAA